MHVSVNDSNLNARLCPLIRISRHRSGARRAVAASALAFSTHVAYQLTTIFQSTYTGVKHEYKNTNVD